jgi:carbohydrate diacid regulator
LREILCGEVPKERIEEKNHQFHLKSGEYVLYVIQFSRENDAIVLETLKHLFVVHAVDYLVEMDGTKVALIKNIRGIENGDFEQYARVIVDNLQAEAMTNVWIGYGDVVDAFSQMSTAYQNATTAVKIGRIFYGEEHVFYYSKLGLGRLIYQLPMDLCELFLQEVLGENTDLDFDEETLTTINQLFENNLNISETARQLYIHRNTLVYRLERIEKKLGLDIRSFEDAMLFKIAMMVRTHLNRMREEA